MEEDDSESCIKSMSVSSIGSASIINDASINSSEEPDDNSSEAGKESHILCNLKAAICLTKTINPTSLDKAKINTIPKLKPLKVIEGMREAFVHKHYFSKRR